VLELRTNGVFVMDTAEHASEQALAEAALAAVAEPTRVLVGGLGLGFTLDRVLADRRVEQVDVVEIEPALVEWMRDGTIPHGRQLLADERARVVVADIAQAVLEAGPATYDVMLLDVDNGPDQLVHEGNAALYGEPFLRAVRAGLRPGGALVVWSAERSTALADALRSVFGGIEERKHAVRLQDRDEHYWIYAGRRG
jgi:spermidine synthase